jgi:gamma-glutamylcyclotransferase (GGCT)/AIG2-like uncharacterized protein YtfP
MGAYEAHLFVYGTLLPGDVRWPILEPFAIDEGAADAVRGLLFDTGLDYPAAVFDPDADALVLGRCYRLRPDTLDEALVRLDVEEDVVLGLYRRVEVTTEAGVTAWAYRYGDGLELTPIPSGNWFDRPLR